VLGICGTASAAEQPAAAAPLDRLKARSAEARWREINAGPAVQTIAPTRRHSVVSDRATASQPDARPRVKDLGSITPATSPATSPAADSLPPEDLANPFTGSRNSVAQPVARPDQPLKVQKVARALPQPEFPNLRGSPLDPIPFKEPPSDPSQLRKVNTILPYDDYEPDSDVAKNNRCRNLCPRPGDKYCPECLNQKTGELGNFSELGEPGKQGRVDCPECPEEIGLVAGTYTPRNFPTAAFHWEASNISYLPLYFEDPALERYGHSRHYVIQPFFSAARAATQAVGLPYQMVIDPICKIKYPLGYMRPGEFVPYKYYQIPWNTEAALTEAGFIAGGYFLFSPGWTP